MRRWLSPVLYTPDRSTTVTCFYAPESINPVAPLEDLSGCKATEFAVHAVLAAGTRIVLTSTLMALPRALGDRDLRLYRIDQRLHRNTRRARGRRFGKPETQLAGLPGRYT
jgi:hypothetical protein